MNGGKLGNVLNDKVIAHSEYENTAQKYIHHFCKWRNECIWQIKSCKTIALSDRTIIYQGKCRAFFVGCFHFDVVPSERKSFLCDLFSLSRACLILKSLYGWMWTRATFFSALFSDILLTMVNFFTRCTSMKWGCVSWCPHLRSEVC